MCAFNDARSPSSMIASRPDTKIEARGLCCARWESRQTQDWLRFDYCCCSVNNVHPKNSILLLFSEICSPTEQALTIIVVVHRQKSILVPSIILGGHECPVLSFTFSSIQFLKEIQDSTVASIHLAFDTVSLPIFNSLSVNYCGSNL